MPAKTTDLLGIRVLAVILAGGEGGRLDVLTEERAKPAIPFAGVYRLIDFVLSNCMHSKLQDVWLVQQYQAHSLSEHVANGRPWDLDRTHGGLRVVQPYLGRSESGWYKGNADAIYRNKTELARSGADLLLVLSADHVYKLDYREAIARHLERDAEVTMVTTRVDPGEAGRFGVVRCDGEGRVLEFAYKPEEPAGDLVTTEVFVYDLPTLLETLEELAEASGADETGEDEDGSGLQDFGHELLPRLVERGRAYEHRLEGYWRDVGTVESYFDAHMELLAGDSALELGSPEWAIFTPSEQRPPAFIHASARLEESLVSPGCVVSGHVARSVLAPGAVVEEGASVRDAILLQDALVETGARVERAILDEGVRVERGASVGEGAGEEITLVGRAARIAAGTRVGRGERVQPG